MPHLFFLSNLLSFTHYATRNLFIYTSSIQFDKKKNMKAAERAWELILTSIRVVVLIVVLSFICFSYFYSQLYHFLFQQCLDSQEFDKSQNYQDRIISPQSAVRITGFPLRNYPKCSPLFQINPGYFRVFHKVSKQQQINCLP